ncbi:Imm30 family immunity protein [Geitlerinema splendidum]|nr:Imm30 family immunity protein [Geitlerinema splendidum]
MSQNSWIKVLEANHLLRSPDEIAAFEQALAELAQNPNPDDLPELHLILDDACQQPEVMFSLVHFLESFDLQVQLPAFLQALPDLVKRAAEWTTILHSRMMNDAIAKAAFEEWVRSLDVPEQEQMRQLLSSASAKMSRSQVTRVA